MKVRAVTYFVSASSFDRLCASVTESEHFFRQALIALDRGGMSIQMVRIATNSFEDWLDATKARAISQLQALDRALSALSQALGGAVSVIASIGYATERLDDGVLPEALASTEHLFVCLKLRYVKGAIPDLGHARRCARLLIDLNRRADPDGGLVTKGPLRGAPLAFKLAVVANAEPGCPFFPGAFAPSPGTRAPRRSPAGSDWAAPAFAFALENSDLLVNALDRVPAAGPQSEALLLAAMELSKEFIPVMKQLDRLGHDIERACPGVSFAGTDPSVASAACPDESVVKAFESVGLGRFAGRGTLSLSAVVTSVLRALPFKLVGYCGLSAHLPCTSGAGARASHQGVIPPSPPRAQCFRTQRMTVSLG